MKTVPAIEMAGITRRCGIALANDDVSLRVDIASVHAILGENGAGKTTLMRVLYGLYRPDAGRIRIHGRPVEFHSPRDSIAAGIGMVHQHFMLVPTFTVAENVVLGQEIGRGGFLDAAAAREKVAELAARYHMRLEPDTLVGNLSIGEQQRVEILKILYRSAEIIILDEPTAVLTPQEVDELFVTIRGLRESGKTIILITHKLREVFALSDRLAVLRAGRNVADLKTGETTPEEVARLMVGRDIVLPVVPRAPTDAAETVLRVEGLSLRIDKRDVLSGIGFELRRGRILGIAGVEGNGQSELVDVLTGMRRASSGTIELNGHDITHASVRQKFRAGLACIPEDRHRKGLVLEMTLRENLTLGRHRERGIARKLRGSRATEALQQFDVRPPIPNQRASQLSGGNQQKLIVAREVSRNANVLIASQPTRGVDLGATEFIHRKMLDLRAEGKAILLVSAELSEILALSDDIAVMYGGRFVFSAVNEGLTERELGVHMLAATKAGA